MEVFAREQISLLESEFSFEQHQHQQRLKSLSRQELASEGYCLRDCVLVAHRVAAGGRCLLEFESICEESCKIVAGCCVELHPWSVAGSVVRMFSNRIFLQLKEPPEHLEDSAVLTIFLLPNQTAFKRCRSILGKMVAEKNFPPPILSYFEESSEVAPLGSVVDSFHDQSLNVLQQSAVRHAMSDSPISPIHGPPGTGKTAVLVELVFQLTKKLGDACRILFAGPSNASVDNALERTSDSLPSLRLLRIGQPPRQQSLACLHLDELISKDEEVIMAMRQDIGKLSAALLRKGLPRDKRLQLLSELRLLRKDLKTQERVSLQRAFQQSHVVFGTLCACGGKVLSGRSFDFVIIDEAGQALQAEACIAMSLARYSIILAGDHLQLPPTVCNPKVPELLVSPLDRLQKSRPNLFFMLREQYRMNQLIMKWPSDEFYGGRLIANKAVSNSVLSSSVDDRLAPLVFIDTASISGYSESTDSASKSNIGEAALVVEHARYLLNFVKVSDIAIITPYSAQVNRIRSALGTTPIAVGSVDSFQGRESEAVILSFVRSNPRGDVGFLGDTRRTNVAVTRARRQLCVVGDSETLRCHPVYSRLAAHLEESGVVVYPPER